MFHFGDIIGVDSFWKAIQKQLMYFVRNREDIFIMPDNVHREPGFRDDAMLGELGIDSAITARSLPHSTEAFRATLGHLSMQDIEPNVDPQTPQWIKALPDDFLQRLGAHAGLVPVSDGETRQEVFAFYAELLQLDES